MPKFRSDEPPEQVASSLLGLAIIAILLMGIAVLFVRGDLTENKPLQARVPVSYAGASGR